MSEYYTLNDQGEPVGTDDIIEWGKFFGDPVNRRVDFDMLDGEVNVSTIFLGLDHCFNGGTPILWETQVFVGQVSKHQERCSGNREDAQRMHDSVVERFAPQPIEAAGSWIIGLIFGWLGRRISDDDIRDAVETKNMARELQNKQTTQ